MRKSYCLVFIGTTSLGGVVIMAPLLITSHVWRSFFYIMAGFGWLLFTITLCQIYREEQRTRKLLARLRLELKKTE